MKTTLKVTQYFGRLGPAMALCVFAPHASAETIAETITDWGMIGAWSLDCALPKSRQGHAVDL
jgi:hypothetical protein